MKAIRIKLFCVALISLFISSSSSQAQVRAEVDSKVELVQSVPLEADLSVQGVRSTYDVWMELLHQAKRSLNISQFYISAQKPLPGSALLIENLLKEVEKTAQRGVRIQMLVSKEMTQEDPDTLERLKKIKNIALQELDLRSLTGGVLYSNYWVVDESDLFVGSQNLDWRSLAHIQELGVRVKNFKLARQLKRIFEMDWNIALTKRLPVSAGESGLSPEETKKIELLASPANLNPYDTRSTLAPLIDLFSRAKKSIQIQLHDYTPLVGNKEYWSEIDSVLRTAASLGVKVQILISDGSSTQRSINYLKSLASIPGVEIKMVSIPSFSGGDIPYARMLHGKYAIVDDQTMWLGTGNWSKEYFYQFRNVDLIFQMPELAKTGTQLFQKIWSSSYSKAID